MRLRNIFMVTAAWAGFSLAGMAAPTSLGGFLQPESSGDFKVDDATFRLTHFGKDWLTSVQSPKTIRPTNGFPVSNATRFELQGEYSVVDGVYKLTEAIESRTERQADYRIGLSSASTITTNAIALELLVPCAKYLDRPILADGKKINFNTSYDQKNNVVSQQARQVQLTLDRGILTISGNFRFQFQDNRKYKREEWALRIQSIDNAMASTSLALKLNYEPFRSVPLNLTQAANVAFADEVEGDGRGGWTDQGPANDLRMFPTGQGEYVGIRFNTINPAGNGNRAVIALRGKACQTYPSTAVVELPEPVAAQCLYVLHAIAWEPNKKVRIGTIKCEYAGSIYTETEEQIFPVVSGVNVANFWMPRWIEDAAIGWQHRNESSSVGLYVSCFKLSGKPVKKITLESTGEAEWLIPAMTLSDRKINFTKELPVVMRANSEWMPLINRKDVKPGSILDFSDLLDAPAGKYGFARNVNGRIEFEKRPNVPVRFYGANIAFMTHYMNRELTDKMVNFAAQIGYNIIRMHHFDKALTEPFRTTLNPERLDRLDYLLSALKKRGIYTTIDLFSLRNFPKGAFPECPDWAPGEHDFKVLIFLSDSAMKNYQEYAANLLNHVNPYTGLAWKEDPAIISMCMINEDTIFSNLFAPQAGKLVQKRFEQWLASKHLTPNKQDLERVRKIFLMELYLKGYAQLESFYRKLGVRIMTTDQNMWSNFATTLLRERYDLVDNHFYWAHPQFINGWQLPAIVNNESSILAGAGSMNNMFPTRIYGKPFSITEWDYVNPNPYAVEGAFLIGAYAALQDWSMLCRFTYCDYPAEPAIESDNRPVQFFQTINDPLRRLSEIAGLVAFLRNDVKVSEVNFPFVLSRTHFQRRSDDTYPTLIQRLGLIGKTGTLLANIGSRPALPPSARAVIAAPNEWKATDFSVPLITGSDTERMLADMKKNGTLKATELDASQNQFRSSTGELILDRKAGTFQSVTPRSESFVLGADLKLTGAFATIYNRRCFGAFLIASRDGLPLSSSRRILLLHLTTTRNTEQRFSNGECNIVEQWGRTPLLVRCGEADVTINRGLGNFKLYTIGLNGVRTAEIPLKVDGEKTSFRLATAGTDSPRVAYELATE